MFAPKTKCQFSLYILVFFLLMALIPVINFLVATIGIIVLIFQKLQFDQNFIIRERVDYYKKSMKWFLFFVFLPYHILLFAVLIAIGATFGTIVFPFMIIPSYFLNIRQYFRIMSYWWKGNRFQGDVEVEKMAPEVLAKKKKPDAKKNINNTD